MKKLCFLTSGQKRKRIGRSSTKNFALGSASVSRPVRGICIREDQSPSQLPVDINITGVRLLVVEHPIHDLSTFLGSISGDLVWLRWRVRTFISLPRTISVRNLRVLELQGLQDGDLENFFSSFGERPSELRVVDINLTEGGASSSSSIIAESDDFLKSSDGNMSPTRQFLQSIGSMKNLNKIVLKGGIVGRSLPFDFSALKSLRHLDLSGSSNLTALPKNFSELSRLQHLALRDCTNLHIPEDILGEISTLEHIDFKGCAQLLHLPEGIGSQRHLRYLNLLETSLLKLPSNLQPLCKLEQLKIGSESFRELPCSVAFPVKLKELFLVGCFKLQHVSMPIEELECLERLEIYGCKVRILPAGISQLKHLKVLTIISCPIENFSLDNNVMYALTDLTLIHTRISDLSIPADACPVLEIVDLSHNRRLREVEVSQSTIVKLNLKGCQNLQHMNLQKLGRLKFLNIKRCGYVRIQNVAECGSLEEIRAEECRFTIEAGWNQLERPAWSQLQCLNFFTFSQELVNFCRRWLKHSESMMAVKEYEESLVVLEFPSQAFYDSRRVYYDSRLVLEKEFEELLNSFNGVTLLEVPYTAYYESRVVLEKVSSHSAILMCFITHYQPWVKNNFLVSFEAYNGGSRPEEFEIHGDYGGERAWVHVYMWTKRSTLFTDEDNIYDKVSIYRRRRLDAESRDRGDRGWILTFSSENHVLDALNQIINPSAEVEYGLDSAGYGLDWLFGE